MLTKILPKAKNILYYVAFLFPIAVGLLYIAITDMKLGNRAAWLFFAIVTTVGSGVCLAFSLSFREKPTKRYILLGAAIVLMILFLVTIYCFAQMPMQADADRYMRQYRSAKTPEAIEALGEMPKYLKISTNINTGEKTCEPSMLYMVVSDSNVEDYHSAVALFKVLGYIALAIQALYTVSCVVIKEK